MSGGFYDNRRRPGKGAIPIVVSGLLGAAMMVFTVRPLLGGGGNVQNPATDAQKIYATLVERIGNPEVPVSAVAATLGDTQMAVTAGSNKSISVDARRDLERDLFTFGATRPVAKKPQPAKKNSPRVAVPALSGIFIDGGIARAMIGGKVAGAGEEVNGWSIAEIGSDFVRITRDGKERRLDLEGRSQ